MENIAKRIIFVIYMIILLFAGIPIGFIALLYWLLTGRPFIFDWYENIMNEQLKKQIND